MGSSPILARGGPGSSVGRARTKQKAHLVLYSGVEQSVSSSGSLPEGQWFESTLRNH